MVKTLTIVKMRDVLQALKDKERDDQWLKKKELEVCNGLRREKDMGYPGRGVYAR